jgi:hypothetical protein
VLFHLVQFGINALLELRVTAQTLIFEELHRDPGVHHVEVHVPGNRPAFPVNAVPIDWIEDRGICLVEVRLTLCDFENCFVLATAHECFLLAKCVKVSHCWGQLKPSRVMLTHDNQ